MKWPWKKPDAAGHDAADCVACGAARASMAVHVFNHGDACIEARVALNSGAPAVDPQAAAAAVMLTMIVHLDKVLGDGAGVRMAERVLANVDELRGGAR